MRLNKDAEVQALCLLAYWMNHDALNQSLADLIFEYALVGNSSYALTASMRLIKEEEQKRQVITITGGLWPTQIAPYYH